MQLRDGVALAIYHKLKATINESLLHLFYTVRGSAGEVFSSNGRESLNDKTCCASKKHF